MPLPADFPQPPLPPLRRPPNDEPFIKGDGKVSTSWLNFFDAQLHWQKAMLDYEQAVRAHLDSQ